MKKCIAVFVLCALLFSASSALAHRLKSDAEAVDILIEHTSEDDWQEGKFVRTKIKNGKIQLKKKFWVRYPANGYYESPTVSTDFLFHEILPSWNIETSENAGYSVQLSVRNEDDDWSEWYYIIGDKAEHKDSFKKIRKDEYGDMDIDYYIGKPVKYVKYRVWFFSENRKETVYLKRFFLAVRGNLKNNPGYKREEYSAEKFPDAVNRIAPFHYQSEVEDKTLWGRICCPTSIAMFLGAFGHDVSTQRAVDLNDVPDEDFYGIWPKAAQTISLFGFKSYVIRFQNLDQVRAHLAKGLPIMASIQAKEGDNPEAFYKAITGHLFLITGYEGDNWFIVNDPASKNPDVCYQVKYSAQSVMNVWINNGGVGIVGIPEKE